MKPLGIILLGVMLLVPLGCGNKKSELSDSPDNTAVAERDAPKTPIQSSPKTKTESSLPKKTQSKPTTNNSPQKSQPFTPQRETSPPKEPTVANIPETGAELPAELSALSYVPENSFALLSFRPSAILNRPLVKSMQYENGPLDRLTSQIQLVSGVEPKHIDRLTMAFWVGEGNAWPGELFEEGIRTPPGMEFLSLLKLDSVAILHLNEPVAYEQLQKAIKGRSKAIANIQDPNFPEFKPITHNGRTYRDCLGRAFFLLDPTTLVLAPKGDMPTVLDNRKPARIVRSAIQGGLHHDATLLVQMQPPLEMLLKGPALFLEDQIPGAGELPSLVEGISAQIDLQEGLDLQLTAETNTGAGTKTIASAFSKVYEKLRLPIAGELAGELKKEFGKELGDELATKIQKVYTETKSKADGKRFEVSWHVPGTIQDLLQRVAVFQQERVKTQVGIDRLKGIGIAVHNYHAVYRQFPFPNGNQPDTPATQKDKLSWRVHLLPYLDEYELYEKFKLDEAWDSAHNKPLLKQMPDIFRLSDKTKLGHTQYVVPVGQGFVGEKSGLRIQNMTDGTVHSIMGVTVVPEKAVPWTKPGGFELDPEKAANILGGRKQGFLALFGDGRVRTLDSQIDPLTLKALLTISGGETVDFRKYERDTPMSLGPSR